MLSHFLRVNSHNSGHRCRPSSHPRPPPAGSAGRALTGRRGDPCTALVGLARACREGGSRI
ncbi:hypothetical protein KCH_72630 [Kitasatospora cheerisanensis KCTC 2395]|uniref:Uncharacterized protein n=1 Tax=Kitasatospora cheerisanensis KCTC 2395 TaxID=1348663 RepID=A0A066YST0_9ACTN|nr:hypothetical protein KCH_72630 [Kitasatospora cheerisanensis KCTC 2395]